MFKALKETVIWTRMALKSNKFRFIILGKKKRTHQVELKVQGEVIQLIIDNSIKCLWQKFDDSLKWEENYQENRTGFRGNEEHRQGRASRKRSGYTNMHGLLPRTPLPLILYKITLTTTV